MDAADDSCAVRSGLISHSANLKIVAEFILRNSGGAHVSRRLTALSLARDISSARRFSRTLAGLQEELGAFNDMAITASLLDGLGAEAPESATAAAAIAGWQARASVGVQPSLRSTWREFAAARAPWARQAAQG